MSTRIKVCGITRAEDAFAAVDLGADAIGFVFYSGSPRNASPAVVRDVTRNIPPFVTTVGVFVNADSALIRDIVTETGIRAVQLHGDESDEVARSLPYPVIKALRPRPGFDVCSLKRMQGVVYLVDAFEEGKYGGTGKLSDWTFAVQTKKVGHVIVSGGLNAGNVGEAIRTVQPYAVDVSSSIEREPGIKDRTKIMQFIEAVRTADSRLSNETHSADHQSAFPGK